MLLSMSSPVWMTAARHVYTPSWISETFLISNPSFVMTKRSFVTIWSPPLRSHTNVFGRWEKENKKLKRQFTKHSIRHSYLSHPYSSASCCFQRIQLTMIWKIYDDFHTLTNCWRRLSLDDTFHLVIFASDSRLRFWSVFPCDADWNREET